MSEYVMTTFVDEGLVEECLGEADSLLDYDDSGIIDLGDINATIEDPGYILEDSISIKTEKYESSYGKRPCTLPVSFFDICRNVKLLAKCRPISVNIVDCKIFPWYYRSPKRQKTEICVDIEDEERNKETLNTKNLINIRPDNSSKTSTDLMDRSSDPKVVISSEQNEAVSKQKQDIVKINKTEINDNNTNVNINRDITTPELKTNKSVAENKSKESIKDTDLLKYKEIAETIVRNIDKGDIKLHTGDVHITKEPEVSNRDSKDVKAETAINVIAKQNDKSERTNDRIITSPILPRTIRPRKKTTTKRNDLEEITNHKHNFENCDKCTGRITSAANKVIPHSHYRLPVHTETPANNVYYRNMNQMMSQYYATQQYLERNQATDLHHQPLSQSVSHYLPANNHLNFVYNPRYSFTTPMNSMEGRPLMDYRLASCYDYTSNICNLPRSGSEFSNVGNPQVLNKSNVEKINTAKTVNACPYGYVNSINRYPHQVVTESGNKGDIDKKKSRENQYIISRSTSYSSSLAPHYLFSSKPYVNSTNLQIPKQITAANVNNNLVLSQLLNKPIKPPSQYFTKTNYVTRPTETQNSSSILNNNYKLSAPKSNVDNFNINVTKNVENVVNFLKVKKVSKSKLPAPNEKSNKITKSNSILKTPINASQSESNIGYNIVNDIHRLKSRDAANRQVIRKNISELAKIINLEPQFDRPNVETDNNKAFKTGQPVTDKRYVDPTILENVRPKVNGYSPAISPILTFEEMKMLSALQKHSNIDATNRETNLFENISTIHSESKVGRKRLHVNDTNTPKKSKKISLQEYQQRVMRAEKVGTKKFIAREIAPAESLNSDNIKTQQKGHPNIDAQDLDYDSDCTVILEQMDLSH